MNKYSDDELFEELLKIAVIEKCEKEIEDYPPKNEIIKTVIPSKYDHKVKRHMISFYYRNAFSHIFRTGRRAAGAAALTVGIVLGGLVLSSQETKASLFTAIIEICEKYLGFQMTLENKDSAIPYEYELGYLPKGYTKTKEVAVDYVIRKIYKNDETGESIELNIMPKGSAYHKTDHEQYAVSDCTINGYDGQILMSRSGGNNKIIWTTKDAELYIKGPFNKKELKKIAKSLY